MLQPTVISMKQRLFFILWVVLISLPPSKLLAISLYETAGMEITCTINRFLLSGITSMRSIERMRLRGKEVILWRGKVDRPEGILGFIVSLLKTYKGATVYDSYIDIETHLPVEYLEYRIDQNGEKKIIEHIFYDRGNHSIKSLINGTVLNDVPCDIQDVISILIRFLNRANTDRIVIGKTMRGNTVVDMEIDEIIVEVTDVKSTPDGVIYTFTSRKLPNVGKYPTVLKTQLLDDGEKKLPISGVGIVRIPIIGRINIEGTLTTSGI